MESVTAQSLQLFFQQLGKQLPAPTTLYLLGGSALCLLGSPRETLDVDYALENPTWEVQSTLDRLAREFKLDLEAVPLEDFIPLPHETEVRRRFVGRYGQLEVYIFDLYSIALSKIARGFEPDLEDVEFLLRQKLIVWENLETYFQNIFPQARNFDIDPQEFQQYFETLRKKIRRSISGSA